jgi:putative sigma-54 modulation protein
MMNVNFTLRGVELTPEQLEILNRKAAFSFDRFGDKLASVEILLEDINGPRGGDDKRCRLIMRLHHEPTVILEERGMAVVAVGLTAIERAARRIAEKRPRWSDHRAATP